MGVTPGTRLGPYEIVSALGAGAMGEVYRALDTRLGRIVALKLLPPEVSEDEERRQRFLREARAAARMAHPNVATVYDVGDASGRLYLAMEFVEGRTLPDLTRGRPLPAAEIIDVGAQVADALDEAHRAGIVHRDVKPANVMVDTRGRAKVLDFGVARISDATDAATTMTTYQTSPGVVVGTLGYMSPEQIQGREVDARSDVFSLGLVLYELTTGVPAFAGEAPGAVADRILHGQPAAVARFNYDAPVELERIIRKCIEKEPARRYQSAHEIVVDLRNLQRDLGLAHASAGLTSAASPLLRFRRFWPVALACGAVLVAAGAWIWGRPARRDTPPVGIADSVQSIAVLPFTNMTDRPENDYLGDGLAEEVINHLARAGRPRVVARTSAFSFKGKTLDVREIGRRLEVQAILEGSVRQSGTRLRVTAQLVSASDGYHYWSETFDRESSDLLALQDEVSSAIARRLVMPAEGSGPARVSPPSRTSNADAYNHYLRGLHAMGPWTKEGLQQAEAHFDRAIALDPEFGAAWAALGETAIMQHEMHKVRERDDAYARATDSARRAISARLPAPEGHSTFAHVLMHQYNWASAEREAQLALEGSPGSQIAHGWYGLVLYATGRFDRAEQMIRRAAELDPVSGHWKSYLALILVAQGRNEEAVTVARAAAELRGVAAYAAEIAALTGARRFDDARRSVERWRANGTPADAADAALAYILALEGRKAEAAKMVADVERRIKVPANELPLDVRDFLALSYAALGQAEGLFGYMRPDIAASIESFAYSAQYAPPIRAFAGDPRLEALYRAAGLRQQPAP